MVSAQWLRRLLRQDVPEEQVFVGKGRGVGVADSNPPKRALVILPRPMFFSL